MGSAGLKVTGNNTVGTKTENGGMTASGVLMKRSSSSVLTVPTLTGNQPPQRPVEDLTKAINKVKVGTDVSTAFAKPVKEPDNAPEQKDKLTKIIGNPAPVSFFQRIKNFFTSETRTQTKAMNTELNEIRASIGLPKVGLGKEKAIEHLKEHFMELGEGGLEIAGVAMDKGEKFSTLQESDHITTLAQKENAPTEAKDALGVAKDVASGAGILLASKAAIDSIRGAIENGADAKSLTKLANELKTEANKPGVSPVAKEKLLQRVALINTVVSELKKETVANVIDFLGQVTTVAGGLMEFSKSVAPHLSDAVGTAGSIVSGAGGIVTGFVSGLKNFFHFRTDKKIGDKAESFKSNPAQVLVVKHEKKLAGMKAEFAKMEDGPAKTDLGTKITAKESKIEKYQKLSAKIQNASPADKKAVIKEVRDELKIDSKMNDINKQVISTRGKGFAIFQMFKAAISVAAGIALTIGAIAGAVLIAATPVGWALGAAAAIAGIGLAVYKVATIVSKKNDIKALEVQNKNIESTRNALTSARTELQGQLTVENGKTPKNMQKIGELEAKIDKIGNNIGKLHILETKNESLLHKNDPVTAKKTLLESLESSDPEKVKGAKKVFKHILKLDPEILLSKRSEDTKAKDAMLRLLDKRLTVFSCV
jgi:hypothetical protein